jgi:hypothetical protein
MLTFIILQEEVQTTMIRVLKPLYQLSSPINNPAFDNAIKTMTASEKYGSGFTR